MSFEAKTINHVYVVRWHTPSVDDLGKILQEVREARERTDGPLVFVAVAPDNSAPPDSATRDEMARIMGRLLESCSSLHLVIEGSGLRNSIKRSIVAGLVLATGRGVKFQVHATFDEVAKKVSDSGDWKGITDRAVAAGLVSAAG